MAVTYTSSLKTYRLQVMADQVDTKNTFAASTATGAIGNLIIGTSNLSGVTGVLVTVPLPLPAFTVANSTATLNGTPITVTNPAATGTANLAEIRTGSSVVIVSALTVGISSAFDIVVNTVSVSTGIPFQVTSGKITTP